MGVSRWFTLTLAGLWLVAAVSPAADYPNKAVEFVVAGNPGGGLDLVARELDSALHEAKLFREAFAIKNMGGAGGNLAKNYVHQRKGDPYVLYLESNRIFVNRIVGTTNLTYTDVTPVARVMTEYLVWAVRFCRAVDRSGWLGVLLIVPVVEFLALFVLASSDGGAARYPAGPRMKKPALAV